MCEGGAITRHILKRFLFDTANAVNIGVSFPNIAISVLFFRIPTHDYYACKLPLTIVLVPSVTSKCQDSNIHVTYLIYRYEIL